MWKTVWAIVAGVLFIIIVTTIVDIVLHVVGVYPANGKLTDGLALVATSYRIVISVTGAYLTASLAPNRPKRHALVLGSIGIVLGLLGLIATWNMGLGPRWYPIALVVLALPQCWLGGELYEMRRTTG